MMGVSKTGEKAGKDPDPSKTRVGHAGNHRPTLDSHGYFPVTGFL